MATIPTSCTTGGSRNLARADVLEPLDQERDPWIEVGLLVLLPGDDRRGEAQQQKGRGERARHVSLPDRPDRGRG
jgi:hypothetical protein